MGVLPDPYRENPVWAHAQPLSGGERFVCAFCSALVAATHGYENGRREGRAVICPNCWNISYTKDSILVPSAPMGREVEHLPAVVHDVFGEVRACLRERAHHGAILLLRKLIMHIAVEKGAKQNQSFDSYVKYLADNHLVPAGVDTILDRVRKQGNEATHEIAPVDAAAVQETFKLVEAILIIVYELPGGIAPQTGTP